MRTGGAKRPIQAVLLLCTWALQACTDGSDPTAASFAGSASLVLSPSFPGVVAAPDPSLIDQIRVVAIGIVNGDTLGYYDQPVDPAQDSWTVDLSVALADPGVVQVTLEMQLLSAAEVQWSGRAGPIGIGESGTPLVLSMSLYRGPLANLAVTGVSIVDPPVAMVEGEVVQLAADITLSDASVAEDIRVYWLSSDPSVAAVSDVGLVSAASPGEASIIVTAGPASDTVALKVTGAPASLTLDRETSAFTSLQEVQTFTASVLDARHDTLSGYALRWEASDSTVIRPLGDGAFESVARGVATVRVSIVDHPDITATASVSVGQEVASVVMTPDSVLLTSIGAEQALALSGADAEGNPIAALSASWTTSEATVATVDSLGLVTAVGNGIAVVTARVSAAVLAAAFGRQAERVPGVDTVSATAVVEVRQIVDSVAVLPSDTTVATLGDTIRFSASAFDSLRTAIAGAPFTWNSTNPAVSVITAEGLATVVGFGTTTIEATSAGVTGSAVLNMGVRAGFTHSWQGGDAIAPRDWSNADNWMPASVPTSADTAFVPALAPSQPRLSQGTTVGGLTLEEGASLELDGFTLTVTADLSAGNTIVGPGLVQMTGVSATVEGTMPALSVSTLAAVVGSLTVNGSVVVSNSGDLSVGAHRVDVRGGFTTESGGTLTMQDAAGVLDVTGSAYFNGGSTTGRLTAGELQVGGNFTSWTSSATNFRSTGTRVLLDGAVPRTVQTYYSGAGQSQFWDLHLANAAGVTFTRNAHVANDLIIIQAMTVNAGLTIIVDNDLARLATSSLTNNGTITGMAACSLALGSLTGNAPQCPG